VWPLQASPGCSPSVAITSRTCFGIWPQDWVRPGSKSSPVRKCSGFCPENAQIECITKPAIGVVLPVLSKLPVDSLVRLTDSFSQYLHMTEPATAQELTIVPANEASWEDLQTVFGTRGPAAYCQCQRYKLQPRESFGSRPVQERALRLREQTNCGHPKAGTTSGLVAYSGGEPVGWCAVEQRTAYQGLLRVYRVPWVGRQEDKTDDSVWAVTCVFTRAGFRRRGTSYALARAAVDFARERGARALEAYPMLTEPGQEITWGELNVGTRSIFEAAGLTEVSRPTPRRVVMRIDFQGP
jgi:GNAT superfamily N-acetyltransferase